MANRWRYSGKEEQDAVTGLQHLDYGARHYDPFLGSWTTPDPMAEKYYGWSPYAICADDPIIVVDPDGRFLIILDGESLLAIYNGISEGQNIIISFCDNGMVDARSFVNYLSQAFRR